MQEKIFYRVDALGVRGIGYVCLEEGWVVGFDEEEGFFGCPELDWEISLFSFVLSFSLVL